jgi:hypothetical protein
VWIAELADEIGGSHQLPLFIRLLFFCGSESGKPRAFDGSSDSLGI